MRRSSNLRALCYLPLLMVVWANCHPLWAVGLVIVGVYGVHASIKRWRAHERKTWWLPLLLPLTCALAVTINPYGISLIGYEWYFSSNNNFKMVYELRPLFLDTPVLFYPFIMYLSMASILIAWRWRYVPVPGLVLAATGLFSALAVNKFVPVGALLSWPYLGFALASLRGRDGDRYVCAASRILGLFSSRLKIDFYFARKGGARLLLLSVLISAACFEFRVPTSDYAIIVFSYNDVQTYKFLATHNYPHRRIFNDEPTGSLMIFFDLLPVFCDGRVDFFGREFCDEWLSCKNGEPGWQAYLDNLGVDEVVVKDTAWLYPELSRSQAWLCGFDNERHSYWLKNTAPNKALVYGWKQEGIPGAATRGLLIDDTSNKARE